MKQQEIREIFSTNLPTLRRRLKLKQKQLARLVGVSTSVIGSYEENRAFPSYEVLIVLSEIFNIDIHKMVTVQLGFEESVLS